MYIPPVKNFRADPVTRARAAYANTNRPSVGPGRAQAPRDRFSLSNEARLREEYCLRLIQENRRGKRGGAGARSSALPTLPEMARLYADFGDEIRTTFHDEPYVMAQHIQALDGAWRDSLDTLARLAAEWLARREGDVRASNVPLLRDIIGGAHRVFADAFCVARPLSGTERAIAQARQKAVKVLTLVSDQALSLSDIMALLYYRKGLEKAS